MKITKWLPFLAALLCMALLFCACGQDGTPSATTEDSQTSSTPTTPDDTRDIDAEKAVVAKWLTDLSDAVSDASSAPTATLEDVLQGLQLGISQLKVDLGEGETVLLESARLQDMKLQIEFPDEDPYEEAPYFILISPEGEMLALEPDGNNGEYLTEILSLTDFLSDTDSAGSIPGLPTTGMPSTDLPTIDLPTADQLIHEGDGVYAISDDYYTALIDQLVDQIAALSGMTEPAQIRAIKATIESYFEDLNLRIAFAVANGAVTELQLSVEPEETLLPEILQTAGMYAEADRLHFSLDIKLGLSEENIANSCDIACRFGIPVNTLETETGFYTEYIDAEVTFFCDESLLTEPNAEVLSFSGNATHTVLYYESEQGKTPELLDDLTETEFLGISMTATTAETPLQVLLETTVQAPTGDTLLASVELLLNDGQPEITLPSAVQEKADIFFDTYLPHREEIMEVIAEIPDNELALGLASEMNAATDYLICHFTDYDIYATFSVDSYGSLEYESMTLESNSDSTYVLYVSGGEISLATK